MTRRRSSLAARWARILGVGVFLYGTAVLLHAAAAWVVGW
jgi:hypothetical protein